jgi:Kdo2-lipid IVA lauroyltransferase/acyltransferase
MKLLVIGLLKLIFILPAWAQKWVANGFAFLWFRVFRIRRKLVEENIRRCFPDWSEDQILKTAKATFENQGQTIVDFANMLFMKTDDILKNCSFENSQILQKALAEKKGVMLLACHVSNGDYGIASMAQSGLDIHLVAKRFSNEGLDELVYRARHRFGTKSIAPRRSSFEILKALKNNSIVIFVLDQFMGKPLGVATTFFGQPTGTAVGLALFAEKTKAPVVPCYAYRKADGSYCVRFEEPIPFEYNGDREQSLQWMTQKYNDKLEQVAREFPDQWLWLHRRWKPFQ